MGRERPMKCPHCGKSVSLFSRETDGEQVVTARREAPARDWGGAFPSETLDRLELRDQHRLLREATLVIDRDRPDAIAGQRRAVMRDLDDARLFLDHGPAIVPPMAVRLQFGEASGKSRRHRCRYARRATVRRSLHRPAWPARGTAAIRRLQNRTRRRRSARGCRARRPRPPACRRTRRPRRPRRQRIA